MHSIKKRTRYRNLCVVCLFENCELRALSEMLAFHYQWSVTHIINTPSFFADSDKQCMSVGEDDEIQTVRWIMMMTTNQQLFKQLKNTIKIAISYSHTHFFIVLQTLDTIFLQYNVALYVKKTQSRQQSR